MELVGKDVGAIAPGSGWEQRKQSYCDLLKGEGYESPTGSTVRASLELAALMVIAAVSENTTRVSLMAQRKQNEKLVKQAEQHRELVQKEFTESMHRMKAEHDKTIREAARIRDEYKVSARMAKDTYDQMIQRVEGHQNVNVYNLQMECLMKRANNFEKELNEVMGKHERELKAKEDLCTMYKQDLESALEKNKSFQKDIRDYEDKVLKGLIPQAEKGEKSPNSEVEASMSKRIKIEDETELKLISMEVDVLLRVRPHPKSQMTSAYTQSARDDVNLKTIVKDPLSIRTANQEPQATASRTSVRTLSSQDHVWEVEDPRVPLVSREDKQKALKLWKDKMIITNDYKPFQQRSEVEHMKEIKFLKSAMVDFRKLKIKGQAALKSDHANFRTIQSRYYIPRDFCMPEQFFRDVRLDNNTLYWKRCCSMQDFYHMCCVDTPFYVERRKPGRRDIEGNARSVLDPQVEHVAEVSSSYRQTGHGPLQSTQERTEQPQRQHATL
jgi:hypothetical protein